MQPNAKRIHLIFNNVHPTDRDNLLGRYMTSRSNFPQEFDPRGEGSEVFILGGDFRTPAQFAQILNDVNKKLRETLSQDDHWVAIYNSWGVKKTEEIKASFASKGLPTKRLTVVDLYDWQIGTRHTNFLKLMNELAQPHNQQQKESTMNQHPLISPHILFFGAKVPQWANGGKVPIAKKIDQIKHEHGAEVFAIGDRDDTIEENHKEWERFKSFVQKRRENGCTFDRWIVVFGDAEGVDRAKREMNEDPIKMITGNLNGIYASLHANLLPLDDDKSEALYKAIVDVQARSASIIEQAKKDALAKQQSENQQEVSYNNSYSHCGQSWDDIADSACNDRCPVCNKEITPFLSIQLDDNQQQKGNTMNNAELAQILNQAAAILETPPGQTPIFDPQAVVQALTFFDVNPYTKHFMHIPGAGDIVNRIYMTLGSQLSFLTLDCSRLSSLYPGRRDLVNEIRALIKVLQEGNIPVAEQPPQSMRDYTTPAAETPAEPKVYSLAELAEFVRNAHDLLLAADDSSPEEVQAAAQLTHVAQYLREKSEAVPAPHLINEEAMKKLRGQVLLVRNTIATMETTMASLVSVDTTAAMRAGLERHRKASQLPPTATDHGNAMNGFTSTMFVPREKPEEEPRPFGNRAFRDIDSRPFGAAIRRRGLMNTMPGPFGMYADPIFNAVVRAGNPSPFDGVFVVHAYEDAMYQSLKGIEHIFKSQYPNAQWFFVNYEDCDTTDALKMKLFENPGITKTTDPAKIVDIVLAPPGTGTLPEKLRALMNEFVQQQTHFLTLQLSDNFAGPSPTGFHPLQDAINPQLVQLLRLKQNKRKF